MSKRQRRSKRQKRQGGSAAVSPNEQTPGRSQYGEAHLLGSWLYWSCPEGELVTGTPRKTCRRQPRLLLEQGMTLDRASGFGKEKPDLQDGYCGMGDQHRKTERLCLGRPGARIRACGRHGPSTRAREHAHAHAEPSTPVCRHPAPTPAGRAWPRRTRESRAPRHRHAP